MVRSEPWDDQGGAAVRRPTDGVFAEFERAMIRERVKAGLERARAQGKTRGRPTISTATDAAIRRTLLGCDAGRPSFLLLLLFGASVAVPLGQHRRRNRLMRERYASSCPGERQIASRQRPK
jgi:hypothetical protein